MDTSACHNPPTLVPLIKVRHVRWPESAPELEKIRGQVFIHEQNIPAHLEWDGLEQESQHFIAFYNHAPVGTARLVKNYKLTRMAVLKEYRNQGVGAALLKSVCRCATHAGMTELVADAQLEALRFYLQHGFKVTGASFYDAGILHKPITKALGMMNTPQPISR